MPSRSAFSTVGDTPGESKGFNGALTPSRPRPRDSQDVTAGPGRSRRDDRVGTTDSAAISCGAPKAREGPPSRVEYAWRGYATPSRDITEGGDSRQSLARSQGGLSMQGAAKRMEELERAEFDLKMRLYYTEERLEEGVVDADTFELQKEVAHAKRHRAHAERKARAAQAAAASLETECEQLEAQVRTADERRRSAVESHAQALRAADTKFRNHMKLLDDALRAERAENARLRQGRPSGPASMRALPRRSSAGDEAYGRLEATSRREEREQEHRLLAKVRSQESLLRSARADVTTLRRRLRTQTEALAKQKEGNEAVRHAAEQVACIEAQEIARLAAELERTSRAANEEAAKRRDLEVRLRNAEERLQEAGKAASSDADDGGDTRPRKGQGRNRSRSKTSPRTESVGSCDWDSTGQDEAGCERVGAGSSLKDSRSSEGGAGRRRPSGSHRHAGETESLSPSPPPPPPPPKGVLASTIASRGRRVTEVPSPHHAGEKGGLKGRRPWGSSPTPSPRRDERRGTPRDSSRQRQRQRQRQQQRLRGNVSPPITHSARASTHRYSSDVRSATSENARTSPSSRRPLAGGRGRDTLEGRKAPGDSLCKSDAGRGGDGGGSASSAGTPYWDTRSKELEGANIGRGPGSAMVDKEHPFVERRDSYGKRIGGAHQLPPGRVAVAATATTAGALGDADAGENDAPSIVPLGYGRDMAAEGRGTQQPAGWTGPSSVANLSPVHSSDHWNGVDDSVSGLSERIAREIRLAFAPGSTSGSRTTSPRELSPAGSPQSPAGCNKTAIDTARKMPGEMDSEGKKEDLQPSASSSAAAAAATNGSLEAIGNDCGSPWSRASGWESDTGFATSLCDGGSADDGPDTTRSPRLSHATRRSGAVLESKRIAEIESDIQHIFRFFAAKGFGRERHGERDESNPLSREHT